MKRIIRITILALAAIFVFAGSINIDTINAETARKTTTSTSVRRSKKVIKLKKKARTKTTKRISTKKNTKRYSQHNTNITKITTVKTTTITKFKAKKKTIDTTVQTTIQTTTEVRASQKTSSTPPKSTTGSSTGKTTTTTTGGSKSSGSTTTSATTATSMNIDSLSGTVNPMIIKAFKTMNYEIVINSGVSYAGYFDGKNQRITLRSANTGYLLHEIGHYVSFITGFKDSTAEFKSIYAKEKSKYTGSNKAYVTQNNEEYFAESFRDYYTNKNALKSARPDTYAYIEKCIAAVTDARINYVNAIYYS